MLMYCLQRWHRYLPLSLAWNMLPLKVPSSLRCRAKISLVGKAVYLFGGIQAASVISSCHTSTWEIIWLANKDFGEILVQLQLTAHQPAAWMGSALLHPYGVLRRIWESPWRGDLQLKKKKKRAINDIKHPQLFWENSHPRSQEGGGQRGCPEAIQDSRWGSGLQTSTRGVLLPIWLAHWMSSYAFNAVC